MKIFLMLFVLTQTVFLFAQSPRSVQPDSLRRQAYKAFVGQILGTNGSAIAPSFSLTLADNPELNWSLPIYPFSSSFSTYKQTKTEGAEWKAVNSGSFLAMSGKIGASNGYTGLVSGGEWTPASKIGVSYTQFIFRVVKFYTAEVQRFPESNPSGLKYIAPIERMPINEASQVNFMWVNVTGGYARTVNSLFDTLILPVTKPVFDATLDGGYFGVNLNWYFAPSKRKCSFLAMYAQAGVTYDQYGTNIEDLKQQDRTVVQESTEKNGTIIETSKEYKAYDLTDFKTGYVINIPIQYLLMFNTNDQKFYIGISPLLNFKFLDKSAFGTKNTIDAGFAINLPVNTKPGDDAKALVNLSLKLMWNDVRNENIPKNKSTEDYRHDSFKIGFTATAPLLLSHRRSK